MTENQTPENAIQQALAAAKEQTLDVASEIQCLAGLSSIEYEQCRKATAKRLGFRTDVLDSEVRKLRPAEYEDRRRPSATHRGLQGLPRRRRKRGRRPNGISDNSMRELSLLPREVPHRGLGGPERPDPRYPSGARGRGDT